MKNTLFTLLFLNFLIIQIFGQIVTTDPALPTADEPVTITFNAAGTGLEGYNGDIYAHTGLTVNGNQWQYVVGNWNNNTNQPQLTQLGTDLYELEITPSIREFYSAPASAQITQICLVFRSADGSQQTNPDIFIDVFEQELSVLLITPDVTPYFVDPGELIEISAEASYADSLLLYLDDELIVADTLNTILETITADTTKDTKHWIKVVAKDQNNTVTDSTYYYVRGDSYIASQPSGTRDGINYMNDNTVILVLHAPYKESVYVIGDFNDWQVGEQYKMFRTNLDVNDIQLRYWVMIQNLNPGEEYAFQYLVDESLRIADPYTDKILDKWNDPYISEATYPNLKPYPVNKTEHLVSVLQTAQEPYQWQVTNFNPPDRNNLVIYETLIRDFLAAHDYQALKDTVSYFKRLGINAIELMPINEFEGNLSWGYNPSFYFAPDKYYGPKNDLKAFIDECHANGIAVIMDMVLNHSMGQNVMARLYWDSENDRPAANNLWFNAICPDVFCWGNDFNHESVFTQAFVDSVNNYWLTEYKVDGFRFDFTQGFTNSGLGGSYDPTRIAIIERMANQIWNDHPDAYVILEHWTADSEEEELANYGCMVWSNQVCNYNQATMGYPTGPCDWNFSWISYKYRGWNVPHIVGYLESHDEERLMAKNLYYGNSSGNYNIQDTTIALQRMQQAGVFFFPIPGPKMIWKFGELGYDYPLNYPGEIGGEDHKLDEKPIRWDYYNDYRRRTLYNVYSALIRLKKEEPVFSTSDYSTNLGGAMKTIHLNHSSMNVTILGNFDVVSGTVDPVFQHTGYWYDYFSGDSLMVDDVNAEITLMPGEYRLYTDKKLEKPNTGLGIADHQADQTAAFGMIWPNPSSNGFNFDLVVNQKSHIDVNIYNPAGVKVGKVVSNTFTKGTHTLHWDGTSENGSRLAKGIYFAELAGNDVHEVRKIAIY